MRGKPPFPFRMGFAGESLGFFGSWPQRFPVAALIFLPYLYPVAGQKEKGLCAFFAHKPLILWSRLSDLN